MPNTDLLDQEMLTRLIDRALRHGGDYADVFCERRRSYAFRLVEGAIHDGSTSIAQGVGIRVVVGESAGYAYSENLSLEALLAAANAASLIARSAPAQHIGRADLTRTVPAVLYDPQRIEHAPAAQHVALLERADRSARAHDARVSAVNAHVTDEIQDVWIATSDGRFVHDHRPMITLGVQVVASARGERGSGYVGDGGRTSIAYFDDHTPESLASDAARIAAVNLDAEPAPAGEMAIVVGPGGGGVLLHEAVGHGLEGDFNRRGTSLYSGRVGERVASELVTIYDDGNLPEERGTIAVDDEGIAGQHKVLVENGVLRGYMQDTLNARLMGGEPTGSGRRQSFRFLPQPRMCNTYMPSGDASPDEIIASTKRGLYAKSFAGGQVEISKGDFVFMVAEGYLIENGKITTPVKNATIVGNGPDAMTKVVAVGNDSRLARRHYTCGKGGQHVPVGVGMPTVKISSITVGGTSDDAA
ncbi:MAG TPA: metallopeptidase TldD-related protein [Candidatus Lustribacter sp.]